MILLILKFPLCSLHCQWSPPAESPLPKLHRRRCQVGWAPGYEWQSGLICQEPLSRDSGWKVHWICLTKCLQMSIALQGAVTPSLSILGSDGWLFWWTLLLQRLTFPEFTSKLFLLHCKLYLWSQWSNWKDPLFYLSFLEQTKREQTCTISQSFADALCLVWPSFKAMTVCLI